MTEQSNRQGQEADGRTNTFRRRSAAGLIGAVSISKMKTAQMLLVVLCGCSLLTGCGEERRANIERPGKPDYIKDFSEDRMRAAIQEAQSSIDMFVEALEGGDPRASGFSIRKGFTFGNSEGNIEFIWINDVRMSEGRFEGRINNSPVDATYLEVGQWVQVTRAEVADWMFVQDNELRGGYTVVALIHGSPRQKEHEDSLTFSIDWDRYEFLNDNP